MFIMKIFDEMICNDSDKGDDVEYFRILCQNYWQ